MTPKEFDIVFETSTTNKAKSKENYVSIKKLRTLV